MIPTPPSETVGGSHPMKRLRATDIFGTRELYLVDGLDPEPHRRLRRSKRDRLAFDPDLAAIRKLDARQHFDESRFAGAIVADEPDGLAGFEIEIDAVQGVNARIPFVEAPDRYDRRGHVTPPA